MPFLEEAGKWFFGATAKRGSLWEESKRSTWSQGTESKVEKASFALAQVVKLCCNRPLTVL